MRKTDGSGPTAALLLTVLVAACGGDAAPTAAPGRRVAATVEEPTVAPATAPAAGDSEEPATAPTASGAAPAAAAPRDEPPPPGDATPPARLPEPPGETAAREDAVPTAPTISAAAAAALERARTLRRDGRAAEAARILRDAEAELGASAMLRLETAWCFFTMAESAFRSQADGFLIKSNIADAHIRADQAATLTPDLPGAAVLLAKILRYEENADAARELLVNHVARFPGDAAAHRELGDMAQKARDWALADTHFTKAATLDAADGTSRLNATIAKQWLTAEGGAAYTRDELHAGYRMAARLLPDADDPLRLIVGLYPNEPELRLAALNEVIEDREDAVWARVWKAYLLRATAPEKALDVLTEAQRIAPTNTAVIVNRAETLAEMGRWNDAALTYVAALEAGEPDALGAASDALDALLHLGAQSREIDIATRDRAYDALCAANPSVGRYGNNAGLWYRDVGKDYEKSLRYYERAVAAEPSDQDYINDTALIYLFHLRDRKELCLPMFLKVRRLVEEEGQEPIRGYWDALENLCKYYYESGQFEKVLACAALRADDRAEVDGRPYPSQRAAAYANQARHKLGRSK